MRSPVTIYVVHHPNCKQAVSLATSLFDWFRLGYLDGDSSSVGVPIYFRRSLKKNDRDGFELSPDIGFDESDLSVVIVLVDHEIVIDEAWRNAVVDLAKALSKRRESKGSLAKVVLLPVALHESFYRTGILYEKFNPVRLLGLDAQQMERRLRRAATETIARQIRDERTSDGALKVFLSHAKRDGTKIAETIRDGIRRFGQMEAWYDANDLRYGDSWESPMTEAAKVGTEALIATVTDAYPTRPWCVRESRLARTPVIASKEGKVWRVQPVVAVHSPGTDWTKGAETLAGVPRIGWQQNNGSSQVAKILDRLVLEVLLSKIHAKLAIELATRTKETLSKAEADGCCYITWVPDTWTLSELRYRNSCIAPKNAPPIRRIIYPGHGITQSDKRGLLPIVKAFHADAELLSFEEAWK